jgi:predicted RNase H-like HicB family nuclease
MNAAQYTYEAMWSEEERVFIARVAEFPSLEARGDSRGSSLRALRSVVDAVVKDLAESSEVIPKKVSTKKSSKKTMPR